MKALVTTRSGWRRRTAVLAAGALVTLVAAETALRATRPKARAAGPPPNVPCGDCPYVFELNPAHTGVSPQRLRDREFPLARPAGTFRILVLGDSIPYGPRVKAERTFPKVLEGLLDGRFGRVEVINAGVGGYTPYNERAWWTARGRSFQPNLVVVSLGFAEVADPLLRWNQPGLLGKAGPVAVPQEAVPNARAHEAHLRSFPGRSAEPASWLDRLARRSELVRRVRGSPWKPGATSIGAHGERYPTYLAREDTLGIEVLTDGDSPEWRWLREQVDRMTTAIRGDGASVVVLVNPLRYQLAPGYPLFPQRLVETYCAERALPCLDVLPALRDQGGTKLFLGNVGSSVDVWHYTAAGHRVVAQALATYLEQKGLLPGASLPSSVQGSSGASPGVPPAVPPGSPGPPHV